MKTVCVCVHMHALDLPFFPIKLWDYFPHSVLITSNLRPAISLLIYFIFSYYFTFNIAPIME